MSVTDPEKTDPWTTTSPAAKAEITVVGVVGVAVFLAAAAILVIAFSALVGGLGWLYGTGFFVLVMALAALKIWLRRL